MNMKAYSVNWLHHAEAASRKLGNVASLGVLHVLGDDAPYPLLQAMGFIPIRLVANRNQPTPTADALIGSANLTRRGRSLLEQILALPPSEPVLITHADAELPQLFATLRELFRRNEVKHRPLHFFDFLHMPRASTERYNQVRLAELVTWLQSLGGVQPTDSEWQLWIQRYEDIRQHLLLIRERFGANAFYFSLNSLFLMHPVIWADCASAIIAEQIEAPLDQRKTLFCGTDVLGSDFIHMVDDAGISAELLTQHWGESLLHNCVLSTDWKAQFSAPGFRQPERFQPAEQRLIALNDRIDEFQTEQVIICVDKQDESASWDAGVIYRQLQNRGVTVFCWQPGTPLSDLQGEPYEPARFDAPAPRRQQQSSARNPAKETERPRKRSRKSLASVADFGTFQREWFASVRQEVSAGQPFAVVNANSPQEMLRALGVPFVVNQWWASITAAKQQAGRYARLLNEHGFPADVEAYSSQGLAAVFDDNSELAPWGGLPTPDFLQTVLGTDATASIFDHWAAQTQSDLFMFERSIESRMEIPVAWWDCLPGNWESELETVRLDLLTDELYQVIAHVEQRTGNPFDREAFANVMELVNEQEHYYRKTRDLIAATYPVPVSIVDTMPATMVPQWHRGTPWARDAAKAFYEEVKMRVDAGEAACENESLRLMWIGRGLWSDMAFYQRWEESHGAVFIWSMYLSLAADGYIRECQPDQDPVRALAARFVTMGDELRMPTWAGEWHVREAKSHGVHGAIALSDADPFVLRALQQAGVPVLALTLDNFDETEHSRQQSYAQIDDFLDELKHSTDRSSGVAIR